MIYTIDTAATNWRRYARAVAEARTPLDEDVCTCGDVLDEHESGGPCTVCPCVHFEAAS